MSDIVVFVADAGAVAVALEGCSRIQPGAVTVAQSPDQCHLPRHRRRHANPRQWGRLARAERLSASA